jgi:hypothetical protein
MINVFFSCMQRAQAERERQLRAEEDRVEQERLAAIQVIAMLFSYGCKSTASL